jgi:Trypsin-like peptidase domain
MRRDNRIGRRQIAVGLMAIIGWFQGSLEGATSQEPPRKGSGGAQAPAQVRPVELPAEMVSRCKAATALIELRSIGSGSAACVSVDGFFVTNYHVVAGAGLGQDVRLVVRPGQNSQRVVAARVIKLDEENDLALLKVDGPADLVAIPLGTDDELVETTPLTAFGYPFGRMLASDSRYPSVSVNTGAITALRRKEGKLSAIQLDASVNPGNSGGPVVDRNGKLLGIVTSGVSGGARLNFAIPVSIVREFLAGPALVLRNPAISFAERTKTRQFEIDAYALDRRLLDDIVVELSFMESADQTRTLEAKRKGKLFVAEGSACAKGGAPLKPILVVQKGRGQKKSELPPGEFSIGSRKFSWLSIDSLVKDGDVWIVSLLGGERFAGKAVGLPSVTFGAGRTTQLATADRIEMRLEKAPPSASPILAPRSNTVGLPSRNSFRE